MKLAHILTACDNNPRYTKFIPLFIEAWKRLSNDLRITILFISQDPLPEECKAYEQYIHRYVYPNSKIHPTFIAQVIRILWPALLKEEDGILITDMDMIPGKLEYYSQSIQEYSTENTFISYRPKSCVPPEQVAICYNIANSKTWSLITGIQCEADIDTFLERYSPTDYNADRSQSHWYSDQTILYQKIESWKSSNPIHQHIYLTDEIAGFCRFDFYHHNYNIPFFLQYYKTNQFSDAHLYGSQCIWTPGDIHTIVNGLNS
jgi:hypothetical protein